VKWQSSPSFQLLECGAVLSEVHYLMLSCGCVVVVLSVDPFAVYCAVDGPRRGPTSATLRATGRQL